MERGKQKKAVALNYDESTGNAPCVIASGQGKIAEKIIRLAQESGIHIQENTDLVELLSKVPIGDEIPVELYQTVAEILAFVYQLNSKYKENQLNS